ncbi:hypothetical protein ES703_36624 [subsurface metagenome]
MIKKFLKFIGPVFIICFLGYVFTLPAQASQENYVCMVYFTGIGCSSCEMTSRLVLEQLPREYSNLVVIEYDIYEREQNVLVFDEYVSTYHTGYRIPLVIFGQDKYLSDHLPIENNVSEIIDELDFNRCPLIDGSAQDFNDLDLNSLPAYPKIWHQEKVLIKTGPQGDGELLKALLIDDNLADVLKDAEFETIEPIAVAIPGGEVKFDNGILVDDWIFQWNGEGIGTPPEPAPLPPAPVPPEPVPVPPEPAPVPPEPEPTPPEVANLTLVKVLSLAAADAVNPCAFAVLLLMLVSIAAYNPGNRRSILFAGLAFIGAVFAMYLVYGLLLIKFYQEIQQLKDVGDGIYRGLSVAAIVFGALNIRDFVRYKPGGIGTEMPLFMRPRVKKIINNITSTKGAFVTGLIVTFFLLPCTIGPYVIASKIMADVPLAEGVPMLLLYNLIFIIPLTIIVSGVYLGTSRIHDFYLWKERNISKLHLIAGIILLGLGIFMLLESLGIVVFWGIA